MGKEKKRSESKRKRTSRLSVLDRTEELTSQENTLRDASDIDVRRRESIAEFQLANIETLAKETRAYWVIGKQIEINKEIEEKFRVVDKESIKLNEKLLQFMNQLKDKRKSTNAMKTNLLEAQCQNLDIFESKRFRQFLKNSTLLLLKSVKTYLAGIFRHLKPRIAEVKKNNQRAYALDF
ncbi:unnamed protein product [Oikopleura dioica]|uniref:Uncharacterized protein n=1 Tax=Oikopleura dioica TaxID=34765 RepID=E4Z363_OIKDI|nr:unnamed protein product [Oikopleura dioica]